MRLITGTDILEFHTDRADYLAINAAGEFVHLDSADIESNVTDSYQDVITTAGETVQLLLPASTIAEGEWFPDAIDEDGTLDPAAAESMASIINQDADLHGHVLAHEARQATDVWKKAQAEADRLAMERARKVAAVVDYDFGNQSRAARRLGLDQSTVNRLVKKAHLGS